MGLSLAHHGRGRKPAGGPLFIALSLIACGCAKHAPPPVEAAIKARLQQYHDAWEAGDANALRDVFLIETQQDQAFADAMARMASAQLQLRTETHKQMGMLAQAIVGTSLPQPLVGTRWRDYAMRTRDPQEFIVEPPYVIARKSKDNPPLFYLREQLGYWKIDTKSFTRVQPLDVVTKSIEKSIASTTEAIAAMKAGDTQALQKITIRDAFGSSGSMPPELRKEFDKILVRESAKENPP